MWNYYPVYFIWIYQCGQYWTLRHSNMKVFLSTRASRGTDAVGTWLFITFSFVGSRSPGFRPCHYQGWQCFVHLKQRAGLQEGKTLNIYHLWGTLLAYVIWRPSHPADTYRMRWGQGSHFTALSKVSALTAQGPAWTLPPPGPKTWEESRDF